MLRRVCSAVLLFRFQDDFSWLYDVRFASLLETPGTSDHVQAAFLQELLEVYSQRHRYWDPKQMLDNMCFGCRRLLVANLP